MRITPRKRLFVDPQVQGALLTRIIVYWCFSVLAVCLLMLCVRAVSLTSESFFDYFAFNEFFGQYGAIVLASAVLVPLIMFDVLVISNRFAGPLLRLRRSMRALADGESVAKIQFRDKDFWQDFAQEFNSIAEYVEQLKNQLAEAKALEDQPRSLESATHE